MSTGEPRSATGRERSADGELRLLLVEDDPGDAMLVEDEIAERLPRAKLARSRSIAEALAQLRPTTDCVLLDLGLPDASGLEAVQKLRSRTPSVPLIVLTGLADEAAGIAAVEAGAQDYLVKGHVEGDQLARSIRYAIGRRQVDEAERELLLAEAQAREVARLERGLAPRPLLEDAPVWVATLYKAGRSQGLLGGDFVDLVEGEGGCLHVVVGDVCGQGPDEAALGVSLRAAWRALCLAGIDFDTLLHTLQRVIEHERQLPALFATLCTLRIEPERGVAWLLRAGHPRPVLIEGSRVCALPDSQSNAGIGIADGGWTSERVELPRDWTILLYTDGIIEGRVGDGSERLGEEGLHRLIAEAIAANPGWRERPEAFCGELIAGAERLNGGGLGDDVAMLLVGHAPDGG
ncbi:MAG: PP2C family protein-serine/threonine phosphatase, partial [Solirubrobacteraceae bacterium]